MDQNHVRLRFIETTIERYRNIYFDYHIRMAMATSLTAFKLVWNAELEDCEFSRLCHAEQWERDNVGYIDCDQQNLLHSAVILENIEILDFLAKIADRETLFIRDRFGRTAYNYASISHNTTIMRILISVMQPFISDERTLPEDPPPYDLGLNCWE